MKEFAGFKVTDEGKLLDAEGKEVPRYGWVYKLKHLKRETKGFRRVVLGSL